MYRLEEETEDDWWEVEALYDLCFAPGRTALSSYRLRDGVPTVAPLCLTLRDDGGALAAVIRYWPAMIGEHDVLLLGPVAVHPTHQGEGLGGDDPNRLAAMSGRFSASVYPGETQTLEMWDEGAGRIRFRTRIRERDIVALDSEDVAGLSTTQVAAFSSAIMSSTPRAVFVGVVTAAGTAWTEPAGAAAPFLVQRILPVASVRRS